MESLTVNIFVKDILRTIAFWGDLGFHRGASVPEEGVPVWAMLHNGEVTVMVQTWESLGDELPGIDRSGSGGALIFYIKVKQIRTFFEQVREKAEVVKGLEKTFYGATEFTIRDVDGFYLTFAEDE